MSKWGSASGYKARWPVTREACTGISSESTERGTLEVTFVPEPTRLWLVVHANREGAWIDEAVARLAALLDDALARP